MGQGDAMPCAGRSSPVRPITVVPVCRGCPLWQPLARAGQALQPVAKHDGTRWQCERRQQLAGAEG